MPDQTETPDAQGVAILSGPQVVRDFLGAIAKDTSLDPHTIAVIRQLYQDNKLSLTNLLNKLQEARKGSRG